MAAPGSILQPSLSPQPAVAILRAMSLPRTKLNDDNPNNADASMAMRTKRTPREEEIGGAPTAHPRDEQSEHLKAVIAVGKTKESWDATVESVNVYRRAQDEIEEMQKKNALLNLGDGKATVHALNELAKSRHTKSEMAAAVLTDHALLPDTTLYEARAEKAHAAAMDARAQHHVAKRAYDDNCRRRAMLQRQKKENEIYLADTQHMADDARKRWENATQALHSIERDMEARAKKQKTGGR